MCLTFICVCEVSLKIVADPASKVRGQPQCYLVVKSHNSFAAVREMKYT